MNMVNIFKYWLHFRECCNLQEVCMWLGPFLASFDCSTHATGGGGKRKKCGGGMRRWRWLRQQRQQQVHMELLFEGAFGSEPEQKLCDYQTILGFNSKGKILAWKPARKSAWDPILILWQVYAKNFFTVILTWKPAWKMTWTQAGFHANFFA